MGGTAEKLAKQYGITRAEVDQFAAESLSVGLCRAKVCFRVARIAPLTSEVSSLRDIRREKSDCRVGSIS